MTRSSLSRTGAPPSAGGRPNTVAERDCGTRHRTAIPSDAVVDCFVHGVAHLIDEMGLDAGVAWAAGAVVALGEALDGRVDAGVPREAAAPRPHESAERRR